MWCCPCQDRDTLVERAKLWDNDTEARADELRSLEASITRDQQQAAHLANLIEAVSATKQRVDEISANINNEDQHCERNKKLSDNRTQ